MCSYVNQVCHGVGRCVADGSCSWSSLSESQWTVLMGYLILCQQMKTPSNTSQMTFFLSGRQRTGALCVQQSPTAAAR